MKDALTLFDVKMFTTKIKHKKLFSEQRHRNVLHVM